MPGSLAQYLVNFFADLFFALGKQCTAHLQVYKGSNPVVIFLVGLRKLVVKKIRMMPIVFKHVVHIFLLLTSGGVVRSRGSNTTAAASDDSFCSYSTSFVAAF